jgi:Domain of unknown function (DUF4160)
MAKLTCFSIPGMELWFWSNDHEPAHFHAKRKGEWLYKVNFQNPAGEMFECIWSTKKSGMPKADWKLLEEMVEKYRDEIQKEWEKKVI